MDVSSIVSATSSLPGALNPRALASQSPAAQRKVVAGQFEAILLRQFLSDSVGSMMGGQDSAQGSIYGYMLTDTLAQSMAAGGGLGLTKVIEQQLAPRGQSAPAAATPKGTS
jgi:Rod binding domain-containing protein